MMLAFTAKIYPQCVNADFSNGDFTNWIGTTGENSGGVFSNQVMGIVQGVTNSLPTDPGRQTIINVGYWDANTNGLLWTLPPGATSCARLGNENVNYEAERLAYTIHVNPTNSVFTYQYAVVLEDPAHPVSDQPKFTIYVVDSLQNIADSVCGIYQVSSSAGIPGWQDATHAADGEADHWKDWTTVGVDLSPYINHQVTIVFTTYDCAQGAHFGYAYIACHCGALAMQQQCQGSSDVLTAPPGFSSYLWSTGETTQSITIANPVNGDTVHVHCLSVQGCAMDMSLVLDIQPVSFTVNSPTICLGSSATLTPTGSGLTYNWSNGSVGSPITVSPTVTTTYLVTATASGGCSDTSHATVVVDSILATISHVDSVLCNGQSTGSATVIASLGAPNYTYSWNTNPAQNSATATSLPAGTYIVTATDADGCTSTASAVVDQPTLVSPVLTPTNEGCLHSCTGGIATSVSGGTGPYTYAWTEGETTSSLTGLCAGTYTVSVTDSHNCEVTESATVGTNTLINATFTANPSEGTIPLNVQFTFTGTGANTYQWDFGDGNTSTLQNPTDVYNVAGTYNVILIINSGSPDFCADTVSMPIVAELPSFLIVPNVFTPNGDGHNDMFTVSYQSIVSFDCVIFNRWGNKIFEWSDVSKGWEGKTEGGAECSDGVYYYILSAKGVDKIDYEMHGTVTLFRHP